MKPFQALAALAIGVALMAPGAAQAAEGPELAHFDPASGRWHVRDSLGSITSFFYGVPGDLPLLGDWDCDGVDTVGMYRPSNGFAYLRNANTQGFADLEFFYGMKGDIPLAGDWEGDGCDTLAIYRSGRVYVRNSLGTGPADFDYLFGVPGDRPFTGDFDGNGTTTIGLYRETSGYVYLRQSHTTGIADLDFFYGMASDRIIAGDWDGDGDETVGIFRPGQGRFYLSNENRQGFADIEVQFGSADHLPVAGNMGIVGSEPPPDLSDATRWSDPATWDGAGFPQAGDVVTIPEGEAVILDVSPPPLGGLTVEGSLVFDERDLALTTGWLIVRGGYLQIGRAADPFEHEAIITLTGPRGENAMGMGDRVLAVMGGTMELHGRPDISWTRLAATAVAGATSLELEQTVGWRPGERIVIASTDFDFEQFEERTITSVRGTTVNFVEPLEHPHWGTVQEFDGHPVDERAEVGHLSRNILIQGASDGVADGFGGHVMIMPGSTTRVENVEFFHLGQAGELARYPFHWHRAGDAGGSYLRSSSIHHSFNRCVTVHGTHNVRVEDNVAHDTFGHCFFLEDGIERGNVFDHNLGLTTREPEESNALLDSDVGYPGPGTFWITNPDNTFTSNVAGGSDGIGFWMALPEHPTGPSTTPDIWPRQTPLGRFDDNVSHSNARDGLHVDRGPQANGVVETTWYEPRQVPGDEDSATITANFTSFTSYKNRNHGAWLRGEDHKLIGAVLADNGVGLSFASDVSELIDSVVVGETANLGDPHSWEDTGPGGRSLPQPWDPGETIRGFDFYDGEVGVRSTYFAGFESRSQREAAALSVLNYTDFSLDSDNYASEVTFAANTKRVFLETRSLPTDEDDGEDGYRSAVFRDIDGSVSGIAGAFVTVNNPILYDGSCGYRSDWNARVCSLEYSALTVDNRTYDGSAMGPITVTRDDGAAHVILGQPDNGPNEHFRSTVLNGRTYTVSAAPPWPDHYQVRTRDVATGESLHVIVAGFSGTPNIYRDWWIDERNRLEPAPSLSSLLASDGDMYFLSGSNLHLKLTPQNDRDWTALDICTNPGC